ncbi:hypothetical protein ACRAWD_04860 [Caulobacter segnis]
MTDIQSIIIQLMPVLIVCSVYAVIVYVVAKKRGINPWGWVIGTLVPVVGLFVAGIFMLLSFLSILDRVNELETRLKETA